MIVYNEDKQALLNGNARVYSRISIPNTQIVFTEDDYISNWTYEDFRYVPDTGFLGQFVERVFKCDLLGIPLNIDINNTRLHVEFGVKSRPDAPIHYYQYGDFIVVKSSYNDTEDKTTIECRDLAKLFNDKFINDETMYPCTLLELANKISGDVGVQLNTNGTAYIYKVNETSFPIGTYSIQTNDTYITFTTTSILNKQDTIMLINQGETTKVVQKHITYDANLTPTITRTELQFTSDTSSHEELLSVNSVGYSDFVNNDFVIFGNVFDETTNREVIKAIATTAYSWARINEDNKLVIDFTVGNTENIDEYNQITGDEYETSTIDGETIQPVNKVVIGLKDVEGERVFKVSSDYTEETESVIALYDNPITYTTDSRLIALCDCDKLFGLTYTPTTINSVGHPWLEGDELVKFTNIDNTIVYTYPFNRTHVYTGVMETKLESHKNSASAGGVEYQNDTGAKLRQTRYIVDKMNGTISTLIEEYDDVSDRMSITEQNVQRINNIFQLQGGNNLIKNSAFLLNDAVWDFENLDEDSNFHTTLGKSYTTNYLGTIISNAEIKLMNMKMKSKTDLNNILITQLNSAHTFSFKYKMDVFTTASVKLINPSDNSVIWERTLLPTNDITEVIGEDIIPRYSYLILQVETTSTNDGFLYLYDLLLNVGEKQTWSPASDELYSTYIRLSQLGITILARGSDFATIMSSEEFAIYKATFNGEEVNLGERVTQFDTEGIDTTDIKSKSVSTGKYVMEDRNWGGIEHHIEYFKDEEITQSNLRSLARQQLNLKYNTDNEVANSVKQLNTDETILETTNYNSSGDKISTVQTPIASTSYDIILDEDGE